MESAQTVAETHNPQPSPRWIGWLASISDAAVLWLDGTGSIRAASAGAGALLGYEPTSLAGRPVAMLYRPELSGVATAELQIARLSGSFRREGDRRRGDGSAVAVRAVTLMLPDNLGFLEWLEDLTQDRSARSAVAVLQERWDTLACVAADAVMEVDRELRVVFACPTARSWLSPNADGTDLRLDALPLRRIIRTGEIVRDLPVPLSAPGAPTRVLLRAGPIRQGGGEPTGVVCCMVDASRRERGLLDTWARGADRALAARVLAGQEAVQRRIARELHDDLGQGLTGLRFMLEQEPQSRGIAEVRDLAAELLQRTRALSHTLRPAILDDLGLAAALDTLVQQVRSQSSRTVELQLSLAEERSGRLSPSLELTAYRVAQEALTNAIRHGGTSGIRVVAQRSPDRLILEVHDDGPGFDPQVSEAGRASNGLSGMRDRAAITGCDLEIWSEPGQGCRVRLTVPL